MTGGLDLFKKTILFLTRGTIMAKKQCAICGKQFKFMDNKYNLQNNEKMCGDCAKKIGFKHMSIKELSAAQLMTSNQVKEFIYNKQIIDPKIFIKDNKSNIDGIEKKENLMGINKDSSNERLDDILRQMSEAGVSDTFGTKKEIRALPNILSNDEIVKFATSGLVDGNTVLCICTDKRVLFIDKGLIYGITSTEIPLDMINGVSYKKGLLLGSISITNGAKTSIIENITKADTIKMADTIKLTSEQFKQSLRENTSNVAPIQPDSSLDDLPKLKKLLDDGILTQDEFDAKKKQILGL